MIHSDTWDLPIGILIISHFNETFRIPQRFFLVAPSFPCSATYCEISSIDEHRQRLCFPDYVFFGAADSIVFYC